MSKVILITGCSSGIGRDLAGRFTQPASVQRAVAATLTQFAQTEFPS